VGGFCPRREHPWHYSHASLAIRKMEKQGLLLDVFLSDVDKKQQKSWNF
jgi:hypothetical protein